MNTASFVDPFLENETTTDVSKIGLLQEVEKEKIIEQKVVDIKKRLNVCQKGNPGNSNEFPNEFEKICFDILEMSLIDEFEDFHIYKRVNNRTEFGKIIEVTDIELINNGRERGTFWNTIGDKYNSQRIVFECKNLNGPVDDSHIFQLYMYLGNSTGRFGVILSRSDCEEYNTRKNGLTEGAFKALKRLLDDAGFMIWIWGEREINNYLDHFQNRNIRKFYNDQFQLFLSKIR
jgi:hypothetical protein